MAVPKSIGLTRLKHRNTMSWCLVRTGCLYWFAVRLIIVHGPILALLAKCGVAGDNGIVGHAVSRQVLINTSILDWLEPELSGTNG